MSLGSHQRKLLNDEECFKLWYELKSIPKVLAHLTTAGIVNPESGEPFHSTSIWTSAMRWVLENSVEAREYYLKEGAEFATFDDQWNTFLILHAITLYGSSRGRFFRWIERMKFGDIYKRLYEDKFPIYE